ncbi:3-isopropylmalate dehydratase large subunit [Roseococcus sp.]|uniref:3-isopropylmalate dehydratase large subunit n=1 Tax=Roseococcus sp. TaxID=2109646 RepID=UPI003BA9B676
MPRTLLDKLWDAQRIETLAPGVDLLNVDRQYLLEMRAGAFGVVEARGLPVRDPWRTTGIVDHVVSTAPGRVGGAPWTARHLAAMNEGCARHGVMLFGQDHPDQGIAHVVGPELGLTQPGMLIVCPDSHTTTHGALGALAWGIGFSEVAHVLATSTIVQRRPKNMRIRFEGTPPAGITAKDLALAALAVVGVGGGVGHAIEFAGPAVEALDAEARMTLCNMAVELGSKMGMVAPDAKIFAYLKGRRHAPGPGHWDAAVANWSAFFTDPGAVFDREYVVPVADLGPQLTWGTSPEHVVSVTGCAPDPASAPDPARGRAWAAALDYMGLSAGQKMAGLAVDHVFIGSCTNARLSDLREAAGALGDGRVAQGVTAWVVAGSQAVKRAAEAEGLADRFRAAGFDWREPGCSLCVGSNGDIVGPGKRVISTSNRNFVGRQGPGARTHLASPVMAVRAALAGVIVDPRS